MRSMHVVFEMQIGMTPDEWEFLLRKITKCLAAKGYPFDCFNASSPRELAWIHAQSSIRIFEGFLDEAENLPIDELEGIVAPCIEGLNKLNKVALE